MPLQKTDETKLVQTLRLGPPPCSSAREFFTDAQTSIKNGNTRRAVLELAIAREVATKLAFFKTATPAGAAFEYLENKRKVNVRVIDLLDEPAQEAFSNSFKQTHSVAHKSLENRFRARNRVAHRAVAQYRDDSGAQMPREKSFLPFFSATDQ